MRATHIITRLIVGGAQENTIASVLGLRDKPGMEISLISGPTTGPEGSLQHLVANVPNLFTLVRELIRPLNPWKDFRALQRLTKILRLNRPDLVHTHSGKAGFIGRLAAYRAGVRVIIHSIHGPSFGSYQRRIPNRIFLAAERYAAKFTTHFVVVSNAMTEQYLAAGISRRENYTRIFSGFPLAPFLTTKNDLQFRERWGLKESDFVVGKIARLFKLKGHDDLFAVAPQLVRNCPRIKFLLVGGGEWRERFEKMARDFGLEKYFVFTGLVPPEEIPALLGIMDVLVHLSRREGLARALPQALAAARPIVAYDCDGAKEVCIENETGFLVEPNDLATLSHRLLQLEADAELRDRLGHRGRELVQENFSVEEMVDAQYELYQRLIPK